MSEADIIERLEEELADVRADAVLLRSEIARLKALKTPALFESEIEIARLERHIKDLRELRAFDRIEIERLRFLLENKS